MAVLAIPFKIGPWLMPGSVEGFCEKWKRPRKTILGWLTSQLPRTCLRAQFPDNREKYRELRETQPPAAPKASNSADAIGLSDSIPCASEQGISEATTGKESF
ncbi:MAG: hypothetical protein WBB34_18845 [Xanthobacteraceae bacterium]